MFYKLRMHCCVPRILQLRQWTTHSSKSLVASSYIALQKNHQFIREASTSNNPESFKLVYTGNLTKNLKRVKYFSIATSMIGLSIVPLFMNQASQIGSVAAFGTSGFLVFTTFLTPFLVHKLSSRYVTQVYFDYNNKIFNLFTLTFFNREQKITCTADDVEIPAVSGAFSNIKVKNQPKFVVPEEFLDIAVYEHLVGYDKPLDLSYKSDKEEKK